MLERQEGEKCDTSFLTVLNGLSKSKSHLQEKVDGALLVVECGNNRVTRWARGATEGVVVAGGNGQGTGLHQLEDPCGFAFDIDGALLVVENGNHRVMRWA